MPGNASAASRPNNISAPDAGPPPDPGDQAAQPVGLPGELTAALIREWGPVLKPTGIGLLVALHSFEETTLGHPFYGWAHCTQNALAAYLDTSQDTIARYSNLLQTCGLLQVEEVETPRGKQKLYRVARGLPLPALALLEYLVFDADTWTRKHTAWLAQGLSPLGAQTEVARLAAIMARAYRVTIDTRGLASITEGTRLTRANSYRPRRELAATQPALLPPQARQPEAAESARDTHKPSLQSGESRVRGESRPDTSASCGVPLSQEPDDLSASCGSEAENQGGSTEHRGNESASGGVAARDFPPSEQVPDSAPSGLANVSTAAATTISGRESADSGAAAATESAPSGLAERPIVNVESFNAESERNDNENDAPIVAGLSAPGGTDAEALLDWGVRALGDEASREWHRRCLGENGPDRYRWAIEATQRAQAKGKVSNPGAYFTSLLRRRGGPPPLAPPAASAQPAALLGDPPAPPVEAVAPPAAPAPNTGLSEADCARTWQAALVPLRVSVPADDYQRILRYAVLLELDRAAGWALLGLPADYMREQVERRLAGPVAQALALACGTAIHVAAVVLPGQGRLGGARPTLSDWLARRPDA